jgi:hypothetical protein
MKALVCYKPNPSNVALMFFSAILLQDIEELEDALVWRVLVCRK